MNQHFETEIVNNIIIIHNAVANKTLNCLFTKYIKYGEQSLLHDRKIIDLFQQIVTHPKTVNVMKKAQVTPSGFYAPYKMKIPTKIDTNVQLNIYGPTHHTTWKRDMQLNINKHTLSNYAILIFLNHSKSVTCFQTENTTMEPGLTIEQELEQQDNNRYVQVKHNAGTVVLFDQRLTHTTTSTTRNSFVLQTKLYDNWIPIRDYWSIHVLKVEDLCNHPYDKAKQQKKTTDNDPLLEIVSSLRSFDWTKPTEYPEHLEYLLEGDHSFHFCNPLLQINI